MRYMALRAATIKGGTPTRVDRQESTPDPSLAALYFQFGRHLLLVYSPASHLRIAGTAPVD